MANQKQIKLYSKDKNSLKRFIQLLDNISNKWKNLTFVFKNIKKRKKKVTILKSPHVNKKAQTQFQITIFSVLIKYSSWELKKSYILLKKIRNYLFPNVKIKIEQTIQVKKERVNIKNHFLPKKIFYYKSTTNVLKKQKNSLLSFSHSKENKKILLEKTLQYLKILDHFGSAY